MIGDSRDKKNLFYSGIWIWKKGEKHGEDTTRRKGNGKRPFRSDDPIQIRICPNWPAQSTPFTGGNNNRHCEHTLRAKRGTMNKRKKSGTGLCCIGFSAVNPACGRKERRRESRGRKAWRRRRRRRPCWKITRVVKILYPSRGIPVARLHLFLPSGFIPFWSHLDSFKDLKIRFPPGARPPTKVTKTQKIPIKNYH